MGFLTGPFCLVRFLGFSWENAAFRPNFHRIHTTYYFFAWFVFLVFPRTKLRSLYIFIGFIKLFRGISYCLRMGSNKIHRL